MQATVRRATAQDVAQMAPLLLREGERRHALDPALWPMAPDALSTIERAVTKGLAPAPQSPPELWMLAEAGGVVVGIAHATVVPPPRIYAVEGRPGLILDDSFTVADAPAATSRDLLAATEAELKGMGAGGMIASCLVTHPWRSLFADAGYEPVTLYMSRHGFAAGPAPRSVRAATADDVPGIVALSARHRATLQHLNARFWTIHPEADRRFDQWMRYSLSLTDRDMIVAEAAGEVAGYAIAQPVTPLHIPTGHDLAPVGIIDDFYTPEYADMAHLTGAGRNALDLLAAAESAFSRRGVHAALVVCPAAWTSKKALLDQAGYRTAKLWMLKA